MLLHSVQPAAQQAKIITSPRLPDTAWLQLKRASCSPEPFRRILNPPRFARASAQTWRAQCSSLALCLDRLRHSLRQSRTGNEERGQGGRKGASRPSPHQNSRCEPTVSRRWSNPSKPCRKVLAPRHRAWVTLPALLRGLHPGQTPPPQSSCVLGCRFHRCDDPCPKEYRKVLVYWVR